MARTRTFTAEQLDALGVPFDLVEEAEEYPGAAVELHTEQIGTRRWVSEHRLVFRAPDDGRAWAVEYVRGLTESQDGISPWEYAPAGPITAVEYEQRPTTVMEWRPVEDVEEKPAAVEDQLARVAASLRAQVAADRATEEQPAEAGRRVLTSDEYDQAFRAASSALGSRGPRVPADALVDVLDAVLATVGILAPPPEPDPDTCTALYADPDGTWWQCTDPAGHDATWHDAGDWRWAPNSPHSIPPRTAA